MKMHTKLELEEEEIKRMFSPGAVDHVNIGYINQLVNEALDWGRAEADITCTKSHSARVETLRNSLGIANQKILKYEDVINGLGGKLKKKTEDYEALDKLNHRISNSNDALKNKIKDLEKSLGIANETTKDIGDDLDKANQDVKDLKERVMIADCTLNNKDIITRSLKAQISNHVSDNEALRGEMSNLKESLSMSLSRIAALEALDPDAKPF